ncbi:MAG TPA: right-handed parallel beta-helix repeat-containing protein [Candidatus Dormibacteraeota bacterium]|nr:right-handed parallel beta-helix repeat-containing protein [Candidatus Dormibacteraeota bacterium]
MEKTGWDIRISRLQILRNRCRSIGKVSALAGALVVLALLASPPGASATEVPSTISENTVLTQENSPYTAGAVLIESGVTLTVEPGVEVICSGSSGITAQGTFNVEATAKEPAIFRSAADSGPGQWGAITFLSGSGASVVEHAVFRHGGGSASASVILINGASPTIRHSSIHDNLYSVRIKNGGSPEIADNELHDNGSQSGIFYYEANGKPGDINIHDNFVEGGETGISVLAGEETTTSSLSGNTVTGTTGEAAIAYNGPDIPNIAENTLFGNSNDRINVAGTVNRSMTWDLPSGSIHLTGPEPIVIASGKTLSIAAGNEVELGTGIWWPGGIYVLGTLNVEGTAEDPVIFRSVPDSGPGQWGTVTFASGSGASVIEHAEFRDGGGSASYGVILINGASPTIRHSSFHDNLYGIRIKNGGSPEIADNEIYDNGSQPAIFYLEAGGKTGDINIHDNLIDGGETGISIMAGEETTSTSLAGNTVTGTTGAAAMSYSGPDIPNITENTMYGNSHNRLDISGTLKQSMTWVVPTGTIHVTGPEGIVVKSGITLNIGAGTEVELGAGGGWWASGIYVQGTLNVEGSSEDPVLFRSPSDSGPGEWGGITFVSGSGASVVEYAEFRDGGSTTSNGVILINGASPTIRHSKFHDNSTGGIRIKNGGSPEIAYNAIYDNGSQPGIFYYESFGKSGDIDIHDNFVEGGETGISIQAGEEITSSSLAGNTVTGVSGFAAISYSGPDIPNLSENTMFGNAHDRLDVTGTVNRSMTWSVPTGSIHLSGFEGIVVKSGKTLNITAGTEIELGAFSGVWPSGIYVQGALNVEGTAEDPVLFRSLSDSGPGEWGTITFASGSGPSVIEHAEFRHGGNPAVYVVGSSPTIKHSTFRQNSSGIRVKSGSPTIEWNLFRNNGTGLNYEGSGELKAPNNDWGCASGPAPAGCGDLAQGKIDFKPFHQLPEDQAQCRGEDSQCGEGADPVSLASGRLAYSHRDLLLTNESKNPLEFSRSYSSGSAVDTGLGVGWSQSGLASATELASGAVLIMRQDGRQDLFQKSESGYSAPSGVTDVLAKVEGSFRLTGLDGTVLAFDSSGRIATITDDHGLVTTYGYNENGRLATITDPSSQVLTFSYNGSNHITAVKDSTGREIQFAYTEAGDLKSVTDALGGVNKYEYDGQHRIKAITDPRKNVILKNTYDGQGRIVEQRDGLNNLWKLEYKSGETIVTEPEGGKTAFGFDGQDRVVSEKDQLGNVTTTSYDADGNVDEVLEPEGAKWEFGYDSAGNLTSVLDPESGERSYEYDGQNHLTKFADERGKDWEYEWSEENDLERIIDPEEGTTILEYDPAGQPIKVIDANEGESEFSYDTRGNLEIATDPLEHETTFEYNARNHLIKRTEPGFKPEEFERNALGDMLSRTTPEGNETEYFYDANGMLEEVIDPEEEVWTIKHNAMERPTEYVDPLEGATEIEYDGNLNPIKVTDRRGKVTTYAYDLANQLEEVVRPEGDDWEFAYDARGNRIKTIEPRENATTYEYDLLDRMTDVDEPLGVSTDYEYDPGGNLISFTDPRGNETAYEYDDLGRLEEIHQPLGKTTSFAYDPLGNLLGRATPGATLEYGYDAANRLREVSSGETLLRAFDYDDANRLTEAIGPQGDEIEIGYDDDGLPTSIDDGRGQSFSREYDSRGNLIQQVDPRGTLEYEYDGLGRMSDLIDPSGEFGFEYDPEGNLTDVERPNGVDTHNAYDNAGRLEATVSKLGESTLESLQYEYDPAGNRKAQVDRLSQKTTYVHDALNRLTEFNPPGEGSTEYDYDPAGNRTEAGALTYEFNALNQLTVASDGTVYNYDEDGRLSSIEIGEESTTYEWDAFDNLAKAERPGGSAEYSYDALGRLSERSEGSGTREAHYGDLTDLPSYDADSEGELTVGYIRGAGGLLEEAGEPSSFPLVDAHGDVVAITAEGGGVSSRQGYDPWGAQLSGPSLEMGWLGAYERRSDPSRLVEMGARSYDPTLGSFLSEDLVLGHLGNGLSADRYLYVWDNPLNRYDLNGRDVCAPTPFGDACAGDAAEDVGSAAEEAVNSGRHLVSESQEYWVENDSSLSYIAGPAVSMVDLAVNPDRLDYYLKSNNLPGKELLGDCYRGGHPAREIGGIAGGAGGFLAGTSSAAGDLGGRAVGVGAISGRAGARIGGGVGMLGGCAFGVIDGLVR